MNKNKKVIKCNNSNLAEACVFMLGAPSPYDGQEVDAFIVSVRDSLKQNSGFKQIKGKVQFFDGLQITPPFSQDQFIWGKGNKRAKLGHQFISIHTVHNKNDKYQTYDESLEPEINSVLKSIDSNRAFSLTQLIFQYVNRFQFNGDREKSLNLSDYFHFSAGVDEKVDIGISNMQLKFKNSTQEANLNNTSFEVNVSCGLDNNNDLVLIMNTTGIKRLNNMRATDEQVFTEIKDLKELTKNTFFNLAKEKTREEMEAVYESE